MNIYKGFFDGACYPVNPGGTATYAFVLYKNNKMIDSGYGIIGEGNGMTNNLAEHYAIGRLFDAFIRQGVSNTVLNVYGDSKLVVNQMNEVWEMSWDKPYFHEGRKAFRLMKEICASGIPVNIKWIPREKNTVCDELSKKFRIYP